MQNVLLRTEVVRCQVWYVISTNQLEQKEEGMHPGFLLHSKQLVVLIPVSAITSWRSFWLLGSCRAASILTHQIVLLTATIKSLMLCSAEYSCRRRQRNSARSCAEDAILLCTDK